MPSTRLLTTKDGKPFYEITVSRAEQREREAKQAEKTAGL